MEQDKNFDIREINNIDLKEILTRLRPYLITEFRRLGDYETYNKFEIVNMDMLNNFIERDDIVCPTMVLQILAKSAFETDMGTFFFVRLTPYNCYVNLGNRDLSKIRCNPDNYPNFKIKELIKSYRQIMREIYGERWLNAFNAYINRVRDYNRKCAMHDYHEMVAEYENELLSDYVVNTYNVDRNEVREYRKKFASEVHDIVMKKIEAEYIEEQVF